MRYARRWTDDPPIWTDDRDINIRQPMCGYSAARWAIWNSKFFAGLVVVEFVWKIVSPVVLPVDVTWAMMGWIDLGALVPFAFSNAIGTGIAIHNCNKRDARNQG
jgi:hypothetical protein